MAEPLYTRLLELAQTLDKDDPRAPLASRARFVQRELALICRELMDAEKAAHGVTSLRMLTLDEVRKVWETCQSYDQAGPAIQRKFMEVNGLTHGVMGKENKQ